MADNENGLLKLLNIITTKRGGFLGVVLFFLALLLAGEAFNKLPDLLQEGEAFWILLSILVLAGMAVALSFVFESQKQADKKLLNVTVYVLDAHKKGISSASVTLRGLTAETKKTDANGVVVFANLSAALAEHALELFAQKNGATDTIDIPPGNLETTYRLTLKK
jgi:hypothetical protein